MTNTSAGRKSKPERGSPRSDCGPSISGIQQPWDLRFSQTEVRVAVPVADVLDGGGLAKERALATLKVFNSILGIIQFEVKNEFPAEALALLEERAAVRKAKDWKRSDEIRTALKAMGFIIEDSAQGSNLKKI